VCTAKREGPETCGLMRRCRCTRFWFCRSCFCLPPRYTRSWDFACVFGFYVLAKIFETADRQIFLLDHHTISGHTLKHLAAALQGFGF